MEDLGALVLGAREEFAVPREDNQHLYLVLFTSPLKALQHVKVGKTNDIGRRVSELKSKLNSVQRFKNWTVTVQRLELDSFTCLVV